MLTVRQGTNGEKINGWLVGGWEGIEVRVDDENDKGIRGRVEYNRYGMKTLRMGSMVRIRNEEGISRYRG